MQQLEKRNTYTPTDASQVRSNCDSLLNREETLSVMGLKTSSNSPEVNLPVHSGGLEPLIYVKNINNEPLMPCSITKAKKLLKSKRAIVIKFKPFTIKLTFECENEIQEISLGIDSGSKNIGFSAISSGKELISGTLVLDSKTSDRMKEKLMYRKGRRNKLWHRKPRFSNRKRKEGWLPPSTQRRYDTHLNLINRIKNLLPVSYITIEVGNFDIQKLNNSEISGTKYQQGDMYGYQNARSFLMFREKGLCQLCRKEFTKGNSSHIHHCKQRKDSGSNSVKNLALLHEKCHEKLHKKGLELKSPKSYKDSAFMNIIKNRFIKDIPEVNLTYGYITFTNRNNIHLEKTHYNDAFVIAGGSVQVRVKPLEIIQKKINNRTLQINRNGYKPSIRKQRYSIRPKDLVWIEGKIYSVIGMQSKGLYIKIEGLKKVINTKKIERVYHNGSLVLN